MEPEQKTAGMFEGKKDLMSEKTHFDPNHEQKSGFSFGLLILSFTALFAILATLLLWWTNKDNKTLAEEQSKEKETIVKQITSPAYVEVEKKAGDFKSSVEALSSAAKERFSMATFLTNLSTKLTKDAEITSMTIGADGTLSITGKTKSYRTIADFAVALKSWDLLTDVDLKSHSLQIPEDGSAMVASFSVTAKIVKTSATNANTNAATTEQLQQGGVSSGYNGMRETYEIN